MRQRDRRLAAAVVHASRIEQLERRTMLSIAEPNNTLGTAFTVSGNDPFAGQATFSDAISSTDPVDYLKILTDAGGAFSVRLYNLSGDLNVSLIHDKNFNQVEDAGEVLATSAHAGTTEELINVSVLQNPGVEAYYLKVTPAAAGTNAGYSVDIAYDTAGATPQTARLLNDPLAGYAFGTHTVAEGLDNVNDTVDLYRFFMDGRETSPQFAARLASGNPGNYHVDLLQDLNDNFQIDPGELLTTSHVIDGAPIIPLTPLDGRQHPFFYIRVLHSAPATENYSLTTQFDFAGGTLGTARNIHSVDDNFQRFNDQVGTTNKPTQLDAADLIQFSVSSTQTVFAQVGLRDADPNTVSVTASLIFDANNNGAIDAGETLATATTSPTTGFASLSRSLQPVTNADGSVRQAYFIRVTGGPSANYELQLNGDHVPGITDRFRYSDALDRGTVTGLVDLSDALGAGDTADSWRIVLPASNTLRLRLDNLRDASGVAGFIAADVGNDNVFGKGETLGEFDSTHPLTINLAAGTYFVSVTGVTASEYDLFVVPDFAGDTLQTARNLGTLGAFTEASDHVTAPASDIDCYKFAIAGTQTFTASAFARNANLTLTLARDNGGGSATTLAQVTGTDGFTLVQQSLSSGNYFLIVATGTTDADYTVGLSTGDNDDSIPETFLGKNSQMIVGDSRGFTLSDATDVDMILLNLDRTGDTSFAVDLDSRNGSSVDTFLRIFDDKGNQLASNDNGIAPGEAASAFSYLTFTIPPNYHSDFIFLGIGAHGNTAYNANTGGGDAGGAASGQYQLTITKFMPPPPAGSIAGNVFNDANGNLVKDSGEAGVSGRTIYLDTNNNSVKDSGEASVTTDASGNYKFSNLAAGTYKVREILPSGWVQTTPTSNFGNNATLTAGQNVSGKNFGTRQTSTATGKISGTVFHDFDRDGVRDIGDSGLSSWTVWIDADNDSILDATEVKTTTDASGNYSFSSLAAGTYKVRVLRQTGWVQTIPTNNFGHTVTLSSGQQVSGRLTGMDN